MKMYIKNMVCDRCKMAVESVLIENGLHPVSVHLGEVVIEEELEPATKLQLGRALEELGFELLDDDKLRLIENVKGLVRELIHEKDNDLSVNLSDYLAEKLHRDYNSVSHLFSQLEGTTIEKYYVLQKLEKVKELLIYNELTLNEIADRLNYSSAAYLSNQFKQLTGLTPGQFRKLRDPQRISLDKI